jgi:hypothetical protein
MNHTHRKPSWPALIARICGCIALILSLESCIHQSDRRMSPSMSADRMNRMKSFYVRKHAEDDYKVGEDIAAQLQSMGYRASVGSSQSAPGKVDGVITYTDKWFWDITMYMLSLDVQLREPGSDMVLANAMTVRSSLVRKSQKEMIRETITKLVTNP